MEHNTNQNANYLALLNLTDDGTYTVTKIEIIGSNKFGYIEKNLKPTLCPMCQSRMHSKGIYVRKSKSSNLSGFNEHLLDSTPAQMGV